MTKKNAGKEKENSKNRTDGDGRRQSERERKRKKERASGIVADKTSDRASEKDTESARETKIERKRAMFILHAGKHVRTGSVSLDEMNRTRRLPKTVSESVSRTHRTIDDLPYLFLLDG